MEGNKGNIIMPERKIKSLNNITNMNNNIKINLYQDIINNLSDINAWLNVKMFDISTLSEIEITKLKQISTIDICFPSVYSKREQAYFDKMINPFDFFVKSYLLRNTSYIYLMENRLKIQDRIRSYKGLFYNSNVKEYIQKEYLIDKPYSVIAAILLFNKTNLNILNKLYDADIAFLYIPKKKRFPKKKYSTQSLITISPSRIAPIR